jgi:hypothetical protein
MVVGLPIVTIILFVAIMHSGGYLKMSQGENENISELVQVLIHDVNDENWEAANDHIDRLSELWKKTVKRIQFGSEKDGINAFSINVARLRGTIIAKDKGGSLSELYEAYTHWEGLGK